MRNGILCMCLTLFAGCQTTPGFHADMGVNIPPTISNSDPLHPQPTAMQATYIVDRPEPAPVMRRQLYQPMPAGEMREQPLPAYRPTPERIPLPRDAKPQSTPCQPVCTGVE